MQTNKYGAKEGFSDVAELDDAAFASMQSQAQHALTASGESGDRLRKWAKEDADKKAASAKRPKKRAVLLSAPVTSGRLGSAGNLGRRLGAGR